MNRIFCFLTIGLIMISGLNKIIAQDKDAQRKRANESIVQLKTGALLVQLQSKQISIDAYIEKGYESIAEEIAQEQKEGNIRIIQAFKESFHFCEVYFFLSDQVAEVKEKRWDKVNFINADYKEDPGIILEESFYMVAVYSSTADTVYKSLLSFSAIIMKDDSFVELTKPFPYYLKMPENILSLKKLKKKIYNYDKKLRSFYYQQPASKN